MSTIHQTTPSTPEQLLAGLNRRPSDADVTEGAGGIWERLRYDWSEGSHVVIDVQTSRFLLERCTS